MMRQPPARVPSLAASMVLACAVLQPDATASQCTEELLASVPGGNFGNSVPSTETGC